MALFGTLVSVSSSLILTPFLLLVLVILFLASIGKSIGVRRLYVKLLLVLFEYGRQHIMIAQHARHEEDSGFSSEDEEVDTGSPAAGGEPEPQERDGARSCRQRNGHARSSSFGAAGDFGSSNGSLKNGGCGATCLISRDALILAPDPHHNRSKTPLRGQHVRHASGTQLRPGEQKALLQQLQDPPQAEAKGGGGKEPEDSKEPSLQSTESSTESKENSQESPPDPPKEGEKTEVEGAKEDEGQDEPSSLSLDRDYRRLSFETLRREFELADCLTYIKAGMEAIIEDEVTQRFEAEELKSWNLLTRTNRHYEFISWRLTVIWMLGFLVRYLVLLPLRIFICFVGAGVMFTTSLSIALLVPWPWLKRWLNKRAMLVSFRLFARSFSTVITFHNEEYAPRGSGLCVANHTSPVDVVILASENNFALVWWLTFCTALVGHMPAGRFKRWLNNKVSIHCFGVLSAALSAVITYHHPENKPQGGICVANHTSPIDVLVLACDNVYALIGQSHGGFLGLLQRALARASSHIWFERSEVKDREFVTRRLQQHVSDPNNPPILIFPEGTCINNTSVMQFKKGSFEVGGVIYPVAIKYDPKFGDAFWNSSKYSMMQYLYMMMSSWAIVCDVWYLPPMHQEEGESAVDFANRVKSVIAHQGGLVDLMWDGQLKRMKAKKEWKERQQEEFSKLLKLD